MDANMKQHEVADAINMSHSNYQKIEGGHIGISAVLLYQLSVLFKVSADSLLIDSYSRLSSTAELADVHVGYSTEIEKALLNKIALLEKMLSDKDEIIQLLKDKLGNQS